MNGGGRLNHLPLLFCKSMYFGEDFKVLPVIEFWAIVVAKDKSLILVSPSAGYPEASSYNALKALSESSFRRL